MGVVKDRERPGRGCACCRDIRPKKERRWARRVAKQALRREY